MLGFLDPRGNYSLTYALKAEATFASQLGDAGWYLQFFTASGETVRLLVSNAATATTQWQTIGPVTLDCAGLAATLGLNGHVIRVGLLLVNGKYRLDHTTGASLFVTDIALSGTSTAQAYGYDANGNVTAAPARNLASLSYEPFSGLPSVVTLTGVEAQSVRYAYAASGLRSAAVTDYGGGQQEKTLYLRDPLGKLIMRRTSSAGTESLTSYLPDTAGLLAVHNDSGDRYLLKDHLGSTCVEVPSNTGASADFEYGPFGELLGAPSGDDLPYRYTGQEQDQTLQIFNYNARLYDPALRRFYGCDPAEQFPSPYVYTGNDPINHTDPTGGVIRHVFSLGLSFLATYFPPVRDRYLAGLGTGNDIISLNERDWVQGSSLFFMDRIMPYLLSRYKTQNIADVERSNAMAHFAWQSHLTFIHGVETARYLGDSHESGVTRPGPDTIADKINNALGRQATLIEDRIPYAWSMLQHVTTLGLIKAKTTIDSVRDSFVKDSSSSLHWWFSLSHFIPNDTTDWLFEREWRAGNLAKATTDTNLFAKLNSAEIHTRFTIPLLNLSRTYGVRPQDILTSGELDLLRSYSHWYPEWDDQ